MHLIRLHDMQGLKKSSSTDESPLIGEKRRPGRPRLTQRQADEAKARISGVARSLFIEHGYEGVSIRKIATHAGCSMGVIYNLFRGKREILQSIWDDIFLVSFKQCHNAAIQHENSIPRLRAFCTAYVRYWEENPEQFRMIYLLDEGENKDQYYAKHSFAYWKYEWVTQQIEQGMASGELRCRNNSTPALVIAESLFAVVQGLTYTSIFRTVFWDGKIPNLSQQLKQEIIDSTIDAVFTGFFE